MRRFCSIFSQLMQLFPRIEFEQLVEKHKAERHARGFRCWGQFLAMMFCQLGQAQSLREICGGLAATEGRLKHLGLSEAPKRSTLSYANEHRPWELYQSVFGALRQKCEALVKPGKFRFKNRLLTIDGTLIELCVETFDWALYRRTKGAVKLHLLLDNNGYLPRFAVITEGKASEVKIARQWEFEPGTIVVFDKGYVDYRWYTRMTEQGVFFVTRMRNDAHYKVCEVRQTPKRGGIISDEVVQLGSPHFQQPVLFRRIVVEDAESGKRIVLLTNHLKFGPVTISGIYRERWKIECFFRMLKQNLRVKTFVGTSANALQIQLWTALIAILVLRYLQLRARYGWSTSNLVALLRQQLFVYRDLWAWLDEPFEPPPVLAVAEQLSFAL